MTAPAFTHALGLWIVRHFPTLNRHRQVLVSAEYLNVTTRELEDWLTGTLPAADRLAAVRERIAGK